MASLPVEARLPVRLTLCSRARAAMVESRARRRDRRPRTALVKLLVAGSAVLPLGLLTAGCSNGLGTKAAATSAGGVTSAAGVTTAAPSTTATTATATATTAAATTASAATGGSAAATGSAMTSATSSATSSSATPGSAAATAGAAAATSAATSGTAAALALCTMLPTSQVASLSGKALTHSREEDSAELDIYTCGYFTASGVGGLSVTVRTMDGATAYANTLNTETHEGAAEHVTPVAGFGDKAFSAQDGLHALFGDRLITVAGLTSVPQAEAIIQAVQTKLT